MRQTSLGNSFTSSFSFVLFELLFRPFEVVVGKLAVVVAVAVAVAAAAAAFRPIMLLSGTI